MSRLSSYLDEILALCFCDKWLEFRSSEGVDETSFRDDEKEDLGSGKNRELICLKIVMICSLYIYFSYEGLFLPFS